MQEADISGIDVWMWGLPLPVREEVWKNIDFPLGPPGGEDVLNILLKPQWKIRCRKSLGDQRRQCQVSASLEGEIFLMSCSHLLASLREHRAHSAQIFFARSTPQHM